MQMPIQLHQSHFMWSESLHIMQSLCEGIFQCNENDKTKQQQESRSHWLSISSSNGIVPNDEFGVLKDMNKNKLKSFEIKRCTNTCI